MSKRSKPGSIWDSARPMPKGKSPLEGLAETLKNMTPEEHEEMRARVKKAMEERDQDEEDRQNQTGKYAPPKGVCVVCSGEVVAKVTREYRGDPMHQIIGPGGRNQMSSVHHGWHCVSCGLRYEFIPTGPKVGAGPL